MPVRALLWDADGVLQVTPTDAWSAAALVVSQFPDHLTGGSVTEPAVVAACARLGFDDGLRDEILSVWSRFELLEASLDVVATVRAQGIACYLATNQDSLRASAMRERTPYHVLLDGAYYSCDLGVAKPDAGFFTAILDDLGLPPGEVLFVDDNADNVAGARDVGLHAEYWVHTDGIDALVELLARHGVHVPADRPD